ncbi:MAG: UDP-N-acetylmuramate dehydrogenase [Pseudomonadota bacterium]
MSEAGTCRPKKDERARPVSGSTGKPAWADAFNDQMSDFWNGDVCWNGVMADYTTFRVGGPAEAIVFPRGRNELCLLIQGLRKINIPWILLGRGSNVVVADEGLKGVVIILGRDYGEIVVERRFDDGALVRVEAGCGLGRFVNWTVKNGLSGLEFGVGIPGSVGGAIVMNAGAWQKEMKDVLAMVTVMNGKGCCCVKKMEEMHFSYRTWGEKKDKIALEGFFRLKSDDPQDIQGRCSRYQELRRERQPGPVASGGSFFKNPRKGKTAGQLIDEAGLKGMTVGAAMVSPVHANFIVNTGGATAGDIVKLMEFVQATVQEQFGVQLEPEVRMLGMERTVVS